MPIYHIHYAAGRRSDCCREGVRSFIGPQGGVYYECDRCNQVCTADYPKLIPLDANDQPLEEESKEELREFAAREELWYQRVLNFG